MCGSHKSIISFFQRDTSQAENRDTKPPIDKPCMQASNMSNIGYILHMGYNWDMDLFLFIIGPIVIVGLLAMWMFENVE